MDNQTITLLYQVAFMTYGEPDPNRLGTAPKMIAKMEVWAKNGDEAIDIAKRIVNKRHLEWICLVSVDAITGVILEKILNDPLNGYDYLDDVALHDLPDVASGLPQSLTINEQES